jgi:beta-glucosidase
VKNTGNCDGQEIVQLYIRDMVASVAQAPILLKAFERITLKKGESKTVTFNLGKKELSIYNMNLEEVVEPGEFKVMVGAASNDIRLNGKFEL